MKIDRVDIWGPSAALDDAMSVNDWLDLAMDRLRYFNVDHFIILKAHDGEEFIHQMEIAGRWPRDWLEHYDRQAYLAIDPVIRLAQISARPFRWREALACCAGVPEVAQMIAEAGEAGLREGLCVPIRTLHHPVACMLLAGSSLPVQGSAVRIVEALAVDLFQRLNGSTFRCPQAGLARLTLREREVMGWAAEGKSAIETAIIMGISERTVTAHVATTMTKLSASNKTHAVAIAIKAGLLD